MDDDSRPAIVERPTFRSFFISRFIFAISLYEPVVGNCIEISWKLITPSAAIIHQADVCELVVTDVSKWSEKSAAYCFYGAEPRRLNRRPIDSECRRRNYGTVLQ